jgi:alkylmercury lyase
MSNARASETTRKLIVEGGLLDYGPALSRLVIRVMRTLAQGRPVSQAQVVRIASTLNIEWEEAVQLLGKVTERDASGQVTGILGLSLNETPHRLIIGGKRFSAWCAEDTLFLPAMLNQTVVVESQPPGSQARVRLVVGPERIEEVDPATAVVSMVVMEAEAKDVNTVEAIWSNFCHHIHFFRSREDAEQWSAGRTDIGILSLDEGFESGRQVAAHFLQHAQEADQGVAE